MREYLTVTPPAATAPYEEEEEEERYVGCGKSDPNEPVSERPLYEYLWPEDVQVLLFLYVCF